MLLIQGIMLVCFQCIDLIAHLNFDLRMDCNQKQPVIGNNFGRIYMETTFNFHIQFQFQFNLN